MKTYKIFQEQDFHIAVKDSDVFIIISSYGGKPDTPEIFYDGKEHAILYRNMATSILLDYINPVVRSNLTTSAFVTVIEIKKENDQFKQMLKYTAKLNIVDRLPENINLITPEQFIKKHKKTTTNMSSFKIEQN